MGLRRQVHHHCGPEFGEDPLDGQPITDVRLVEAIPWRIRRRPQRLGVGRVGQLVQIGDLIPALSDKKTDQSGTDKAATTSDEYSSVHNKAFRVFVTGLWLTTAPWILNALVSSRSWLSSEIFRRQLR
jgi:hypothetical protein